MSNAYTRLPKHQRIYLGLGGILFSTLGIVCSDAPPPHHARPNAAKSPSEAETERPTATGAATISKK